MTKDETIKGPNKQSVAFMIDRLAPLAYAALDKGVTVVVVREDKMGFGIYLPVVIAGEYESLGRYLKELEELEEQNDKR